MKKEKAQEEKKMELEINTPRKKRLTGSLPARIVAFFLLAASVLAGTVATAISSYLFYEDVYTYGDSRKGLEMLAKDLMAEEFAYDYAVTLWNSRYVFPVVALSCLFLAVICFVFLMCSVGRKNGKSGVTPSVLTILPLDLLTVGFGVVALILGIPGAEYINFLDLLPALVLLSLVCAGEAVWCTLYCMEAALRLKQGKWWRNTIIYMVCSLIVKVCKFLAKSIWELFRRLPLVAGVMLIYLGIFLFSLLLDYLGLAILGTRGVILSGVLEKVLLFFPVLYFALMCRKLQKGSKALAEGDFKYQMDTTRMVLGFKDHGENLNRIGQGISKAVAERMKSEHMKTELITNVSHDLKTPLTSIINYSDLLGSAASRPESLSQEKVAEYSEVLLRQSRRLKKLLEDLVDASKATTGSIEMNMEKCQVGVLLSQAVGEYERRFWENQLELIVRQPEEPVWIMADGRRLWRVFDNLLNNICKYAQESSRVYLTVQPVEQHVEIIFRNMSRYPLELTGEELEERFVRGDKSRHMEGNGLGLSIAKSLVGLQNGQMQIVTDGDLFKVILRFEMVE